MSGHSPFCNFGHGSVIALNLTEERCHSHNFILGNPKGTDKFSPPFGRFHSDLRYYNSGGPQGLQPSSPPSISASVPPPAPHPFIAHFYPIATGIEPLNPGYQLPSNSISQPSSAAALVALAASGCVGQNLSSQLLRNFQNKAQKLGAQTDPKVNFSRDNISPPSKKQRQQFDVDSLTDNSPPRQCNIPPSPFNNNFVSYPQASLTAWHQFLRRVRGVESSLEGVENPTDFLRNYYASSPGLAARLANADGNSGFGAPRNEPQFPAKSLYGASMIAASSERMVLESQTGKRSSIGQSPPRRNLELSDGDYSMPSGQQGTDGVLSGHKGQPSPKDIAPPCSPGCSESRDAIVDVDSPFAPTAVRCLSASPVQLDDLQRTRRRKRSSPMVETCPVCGVTVRPSEVASHIQQELEGLERIPTETKRKSATFRRSSAERRSSAYRGQGSSATSATSSSKRLSDRDLSPKTNRCNRLKTYQKVRGNRMDRLNARVGHCMQPHNAPTSLTVLGATGRLWAASSSGGNTLLDDTTCPVCSSRLSGSVASASDHVEACLRRQRAASRQTDEDELVDVEGNTENPSQSSSFPALAGTGSNDDDRSSKSFSSEYEWCGQARVRVTALAESTSRLAAASGYHVIRPSSPGADQYLNVETDDTQCFGPVQFTEEDLNACRTPPDAQERNKKPSKSGAKSGTPFATISPDAESRDDTDDCASSPNHNAGDRSLRCNICMDTYTDPVASIQCWHVHCERCWLRALAVKKLCPQCNAITTATKLRRIFL